ncbi:MAG: flavin reductase [Pseudonocardiaceae bacterium]|nr:flavin reductase [Pseudonocardiaceae bacterium]
MNAFPDGDAITKAGLRSCLGRFATGVAVVTFDGPARRYGLTVNAFTSVSLNPPLVQVAIAKHARSHDALRNNAFCVNVLGAEQQALARHFAGGDSEQPHWIDGHRAPRLPGTLAYLECEPWREYEGGDHTLFLGEVVDFDYRAGDALGYVNSRFTTIAEQDLGIEYLI